MAVTSLLTWWLWPLLAVLASIISRKSPILCHQLNAAIALSLTAMLWYYPASQQSIELLIMFDQLPIKFVVTHQAYQFCRYVSTLWLVMVVYCYGYHQYHYITKPAKLLGCTALAIFSASSIALADNLLTMYLSYEVLTLVTYPLVTIKLTDKAYQSGKIYLGYLVSTSIGLLLPAILLIYQQQGLTASFSNGDLLAQLDPDFLSLIILLVFFGTAKAAIWPFSNWLPRAMIAPVPISGLLHAVAVVKSGILVILKIAMLVIGTANWQAWQQQTLIGQYFWLIPTITIIIAAVKAIEADDIKELLAYSTINQLAILLLGITIGHQEAWELVFYALVAHGIAKITLFFAVACMVRPNSGYNFSLLPGVFYQRPVVGIGFIIGCLSLIGLPLTMGANSKLGLIKIAINTQNYYIAIILLLSSAATVYYLLRPIAIMLTKPEPIKAAHRLPKVMQFSVCTTAVCCLVGAWL